MDEFVAAEWEQFGIDRPRYEAHASHVRELAKALTPDPDDQADIQGAMWLKLLETLSDPPDDCPKNPKRRDRYCRRAMTNAALRCLYRDLPDGPLLKTGNVDPDRTTLPETD